jgi:hypothetical protein
MSIKVSMVILAAALCISCVMSFPNFLVTRPTPPPPTEAPEPTTPAIENNHTGFSVFTKQYVLGNRVKQILIKLNKFTTDHPTSFNRGSLINTDSGIILIKVDGYYYFSLSLQFNASFEYNFNGAEKVHIYVCKFRYALCGNHGKNQLLYHVTPLTDDEMTVDVSGILDLKADDFIKIYIKLNIPDGLQVVLKESRLTGVLLVPFTPIK